MVSAVAEGKTSISAFDNALHKAGVANFNLIKLSSVIPPAGKIIKAKPSFKNYFGQKLYCVYSVAYANEKGQGAYAGLGWVIDKKGQGLFVEHEGSSAVEVKHEIVSSLEEMMSRRAEFKNRKIKIQSEITGKMCRGQITCALVLAVYKAECF